jgi:hypothetical protein
MICIRKEGRSEIDYAMDAYRFFVPQFEYAVELFRMCIVLHRGLRLQEKSSSGSREEGFNYAYINLFSCFCFSILVAEISEIAMFIKTNWRCNNQKNHQTNILLPSPP